MSAPLSTAQKRALIVRHLRPAYQAAFRRAAELGLPPPPDFDAWRRDFVARACGKFGLRACGQEDFATIIAHCLDARGRPDLATRILTREPEANERRIARWHIRQALERGGFAPAYADAISRSQFGRGWLDSELSARQLWCLFYTISARGRNRSRHETKTRQSDDHENQTSHVSA